MSVPQWLKGWVSDGTNRPQEKNDALVVQESLLMELDFQIREAERRLKEEEEELKRQKSGVDYSWLVNQPPKVYEMPQLERLELEEVCAKVKPNESGQVIMMFRGSLSREPPPHEIPRILRAIIIQILEGRPKEETMTEWVVKRTASLATLRIRPQSKVTPLGPEEFELENGRAMARSNPEFGDRVEDLPI